MDALAQFIVHRKWLIIGLVLALTAFFSYQFKYLEVDSNVVDALPESDPIVQKFKEVGDVFGSNQIGLVVVRDDNIFDDESLTNVQRITDTLAEMDGVISVTSITNMMSFQVEDDFIEVDNLISASAWPESEEDSEALKESVTSNEMVAGTLVADDGTSTIVLFYFESDADIKQVAGAVVDKINGMELPEEVYFAGSTFMTSYVADIIATDMIMLIPIAFVLIALILFLSFKSIRGVILPLLAAALAIIWAIGTFVLMGYHLSMVSNNVPIIVLAVGSAYSIHVFNRIQQSAESSRREAITSSLRLVALPVIMSGLTTMVGFLSFIFGAYLLMIRDFGILAALGTVYSTLMALFFVPALLAIMPRKARKTVQDSDLPMMRKYFLDPLYRLNINHPRRIALVWTALVLIGIGGVLLVQRSVSVADYFRYEHPASYADRIMEAKYGGSKPVFAVFNGDVQSPEMLQGMYDFANYLEASPYVTSTQSIADVVLKLNNALSEDKGIPDDKSIIQQLWFFLEQQDLSQLITEDLDRAVVMAKFNNEGQTHIAEFDEYVAAYFRENVTEEYTIDITGMPYVNTQMDRSLVRSQLTSLLLAVFLVIMLVSLIFKSMLEGLYAASPIIATIVVLYGVMGYTGIPLNVVTVLVASVAMGIGIDYSIHFISTFNLALRRTRSLHKSVEEAIMISGKAIFVNFISVSAGFLVLVFSDLMPMVYFGVLIALSMLGSAMGALTLLPAIILMGKRKQELLVTVES